MAAGDVSGTESLLIEAHLSACDTCKAEQTAWQRITAALDDSGSMEPDDLDLANAALARTLDQAAPRSRRQRHLVAVAAAVLLTSAVSFAASHAPRISLGDLGTASRAFARSWSMPSPRIDSLTLGMPTGALSDPRPRRAQ